MRLIRNSFDLVAEAQALQRAFAECEASLATRCEVLDADFRKSEATARQKIEVLESGLTQAHLQHVTSAATEQAMADQLSQAMAEVARLAASLDHAREEVQRAAAERNTALGQYELCDKSLAASALEVGQLRRQMQILRQDFDLLVAGQDAAMQARPVQGPLARWLPWQRRRQ